MLDGSTKASPVPFQEELLREKQGGPPSSRPPFDFCSCAAYVKDNRNSTAPREETFTDATGKSSSSGNCRSPLRGLFRPGCLKDKARRQNVGQGNIFTAASKSGFHSTMSRGRRSFRTKGTIFWGGGRARRGDVGYSTSGRNLEPVTDIRHAAPAGPPTGTGSSGVAAGALRLRGSCKQQIYRIARSRALEGERPPPQLTPCACGSRVDSLRKIRTATAPAAGFYVGAQNRALWLFHHTPQTADSLLWENTYFWN